MNFCLKKGKKLMEKNDMAKNLNEMQFEEKIKLLSPTQKAYIHGYIEKALIDCRNERAAGQGKAEKSQ